MLLQLVDRHQFLVTVCWEGKGEYFLTTSNRTDLIDLRLAVTLQRANGQAFATRIPYQPLPNEDGPQ